MTYLELVNHCMRRLREDEVSSVAEYDYSKLVGDFVNDAKTIVENAYLWAGLREDVQVATAASDPTYILSNVPSSGKIIDVWNETEDMALTLKDKRWFRAREVAAQEGAPLYYTYEGLNASGNIRVRFHPIPDGVYNIEFQVVAPQADLELDSDVLLVPSKPVIHLAVALLARERGETGGTSAAELFQMSERYLKDAIAAEAARHEEELIYYTV